MDLNDIDKSDVARHRSPAPMVRQPSTPGVSIGVPIEPSELSRIFGLSDPAAAAQLLSQLLSVLHPDPAAPVDVAAINQALGLVRDIGPTDATEAMTVVMMIAAQYAAMDVMRRAAHPGQTPAGRQSYAALGLKAMRTFSQLLEVLNHGRGKGVTQRVIVERVNVEAGGQAVVGAIARTGGGG